MFGTIREAGRSVSTGTTNVGAQPRQSGRSPLSRLASRISDSRRMSKHSRACHTASCSSVGLWRTETSVEQLHALARAVYYGQRGRISAREVYDCAGVHWGSRYGGI